MSKSPLNEEGLAHLHDVLAGHVERGELPGLIALVAHGGSVHVDVIGTGTFGVDAPLERDALFRIASLTKPIAAAAAMVLVDDGVLRMDDVVDDLLPELRDPRVLRSPEADLDDTVPAVRAITVDDLLTYRMGFGNLMVPPGTYPIQRAEEELRLATLIPPWPPTPHTPDEWMAHFGSLPLMYQPGEQWLYNTSGQVLGVLIERAAGMPLGQFLQTRLFEPLGMVDTGFSVAPDRLDRLTTAYSPDPETGTLDVLDGVEASYWRDPPAFPSAASWLVSTVDDYWVFVQLLLNRGVHEGVRIISEASIDLMTADHLTRPQRESARLFLGEHGSWGLGLRVPATGGDRGEVPGGIGWDGGTGLTWRTDADRDVTGILFTQRAMTSPEPPELFTDFWNGAYGAVTD